MDTTTLSGVDPAQPCSNSSDGETEQEVCPHDEESEFHPDKNTEAEGSIIE